MPPKKIVRLSTKKKGRSKESVSENISLSDEDVSQSRKSEVQTKQGKKQKTVKQFLLGAVEKTKKIVGIGNSTIVKTTFQKNRMLVDNVKIVF